MENQKIYAHKLLFKMHEKVSKYISNFYLHPTLTVKNVFIQKVPLAVSKKGPLHFNGTSTYVVEEKLKIRSE